MSDKMPTIYVPHGGGPWPFVELDMIPSGSMASLEAYLRALPAALPAVPRAVLVVSAHWEAPVPTVQTASRLPLLYDYYGFPPAAYQIEWPAPGAPEVAAEVRSHLRDVGVDSGEDTARGFDHGAFVVTKLMYPEPSIPTFQLSLTADLDPARHFELGRALAPLRDQGVFILGSGFSYHNMGGFRRAAQGDDVPREDSRAFDDWLAQTLALDASARQQRLIEWAQAPRARACHPREEHLLPLLVCAGAAAEEQVSTPFREVVMGVHTLAAHFS